MGLQGRLEDELWERLAQLSTPLRTAPNAARPVVTKRRRKGQQRKRSKPVTPLASERTSGTTRVQTARQVEFGRRLSELRGLMRAMLAGSPVNGVTPGVTSPRLRQACAVANWLRDSSTVATRRQQGELNRLVLQLNRLVTRYPALLSPPSQPVVRVIPTPREWRPCDVSAIPIGPESSRWFMDPVNSK